MRYFTETEIEKMTFSEIASCCRFSHRGCWECRKELAQRIQKALKRPAFPDDDDTTIAHGERGFLLQADCGSFLKGSGDWSSPEDIASAYFCNMLLAKQLIKGLITGGIRSDKQLAMIYPSIRYNDQTRIVGRPVNISVQSLIFKF
jgi:hypothetical protein